MMVEVKGGWVKTGGFLVWISKNHKGYGYSSMKQVVVSLRILYEEVLKKRLILILPSK